MFLAGLDLSFDHSKLDILALKLGVWAFALMAVIYVIMRFTPRFLQVVLLPAAALGGIYLFSLWIS